MTGCRRAWCRAWRRPENGTIESFNAKVQDESLSGVVSYFLNEAQVLIEDL